MPGKVSSVMNKIEMVFYIMESSGEYEKQARGESENTDSHNDFTSIGPFRRTLCIMAEGNKGDYNKRTSG